MTRMTRTNDYHVFFRGSCRTNSSRMIEQTGFAYLRYLSYTLSNMMQKKLTASGGRFFRQVIVRVEGQADKAGRQMQMLKSEPINKQINKSSAVVFGFRFLVQAKHILYRAQRGIHPLAPVYNERQRRLQENCSGNRNYRRTLVAAVGQRK